MYEIRQKNERGVTETKTVKSYHSFTFNRYYNQNYLAWSDLRVLNEDFVAPKSGFPTHAHRNQLIITIVLEGVLEHKDSTGNISYLAAGDVQLMSAGTDIEHSEYNPSETDSLHVLQIWIAPRTLDEKPYYMKCAPFPEKGSDGFVSFLSEKGSEGQKINQDITISKGFFKENDEVTLTNEKRYYWLQIVSGEALLKGQKIVAGDGIHYFEEDLALQVQSSDFQCLLFDMQVPK